MAPYSTVQSLYHTAFDLLETLLGFCFVFCFYPDKQVFLLCSPMFAIWDCLVKTVSYFLEPDSPSEEEERALKRLLSHYPQQISQDDKSGLLSCKSRSNSSLALIHPGTPITLSPLTNILLSTKGCGSGGAFLQGSVFFMGSGSFTGSSSAIMCMSVWRLPPGNCA